MYQLQQSGTFVLFVSYLAFLSLLLLLLPFFLVFLGQLRSMNELNWYIVLWKISMPDIIFTHIHRKFNFFHRIMHKCTPFCRNFLP